MKKDNRDKLLTEYADKRDKLERELVAAIPVLKRWQELDKLGPKDLIEALPPGEVFVDVIRYTHFTYVDKKQKRTPSYVGFVLGKSPVADAPGSPFIKRVELEDAGPIDAAVRQWRTAIEAGGDDTKAAAELSRRVWEPIAKVLPAGTKTLYIAPDGDLARLPWAALPVSAGSGDPRRTDDRVLLEDYAVAQVPHGTFLLDQLKFGRKLDGPESLLTLGGVDYGPGSWAALPGTAVEVSAITALAPGERYAASGGDATREKLAALWPTARYIHLATHGEFKADELTVEKKRAAKALESRLLGDDTRRIAAKNPLGYVGLVLSNGDVMSGLGVVDLPLQNTKLVTLSACETGLGELTGGEGVQGLQRAFHLAGCQNVIASLWKVNDAATVALMAKFYHEMWVNKQPPLAALREAQLTIYRHPERIPALAGERGKPDFAKTVELKVEPRASASADPNAKRKQVTPTKLWAAFVLSGVGK